MGKIPKALKKSSVSAKEAEAISSALTNKNSASKKIKFNEDEEQDDVAIVAENASNVKATTSSGEEDEIEVVHGNDISIQKLKELYESISNKDIKNKRKKRTRHEISTAESTPFDVSMLDHDDHDDDVEEVHPTSDTIKAQESVVIDHTAPYALRSKRIGHTDFIALDDRVDYFAICKTNKGIDTFIKTISDSHHRISYSKFSSLKKARPAKQFVKR